MKVIGMLVCGSLSLGLLSTRTALAFELDIFNDLLHQFGTPNGSMWRATASGTEQSSFATYYQSWGYNNDGDQEIAVLTDIDVYPNAGKSVNVVWDLYDNGVTYFKRTYAVSSTGRIVPSAVIRTPSHWFQPRTRAYGSGVYDQGDVHFYFESFSKTKDIWPGAEQAAYHQVGQATGAADWKAGPGTPGCSPDCSGRFMTYGPYLSEAAFTDHNPYYPHYIAIFHLQTNRDAGTPNRIADLEVVYGDAAGTQYLASRQLTGGDFPSNNSMTGLALRFSVPDPSPTNIEFRVRLRSATALVTQSDTKILKAR